VTLLGVPHPDNATTAIPQINPANMPFSRCKYNPSQFSISAQDLNNVSMFTDESLYEEGARLQEATTQQIFYQLSSFTVATASAQSGRSMSGSEFKYSYASSSHGIFYV
jgi:hypothetical protein